MVVKNSKHMNPKHKVESTQNEQAPQDENPMTTPEKKGPENSRKTLNDPIETKRKREKQNREKSNNKT
jgi:hypothetical protein